jgi:antitoxin ParD1/3/4
MTAVRKTITIDDPKTVVLKDLPFRRGQRVEIVLIAEDERAALSESLRVLLKDTQALPSARSVGEDEIEQEVTAHRAGR